MPFSDVAAAEISLEEPVFCQLPLADGRAWVRLAELGLHPSAEALTGLPGWHSTASEPMPVPLVSSGTGVS